MNLIFSHAQRAINGKSYSNRYFFWATHTAPPTAQFANVKKPNPGFVLTRDAKRLKWVTFFPVRCWYFHSFSVSGLSGKTTLTYLQAFSKTPRWYAFQRTGKRDRRGAGTTLPRATCQPTFSKEMHPQKFCTFRKMIPITFSFETMTAFSKFFKWTKVIIRSISISKTEQTVGNDFTKVRSISLALNLLLVCSGTMRTEAQYPLAVSLPSCPPPPRPCLLCPQSPPHGRQPTKHSFRCRAKRLMLTHRHLRAHKKNTAMKRTCSRGTERIERRVYSWFTISLDF